MHTGHVLEFGSPPTSTLQRQKIFVAVVSCVWTSMPITASQPSLIAILHLKNKNADYESIIIRVSRFAKNLPPSPSRPLRIDRDLHARLDGYHSAARSPGGSCSERIRGTPWNALITVYVITPQIARIVLPLNDDVLAFCLRRCDRGFRGYSNETFALGAVGFLLFALDALCLQLFTQLDLVPIIFVLLPFQFRGPGESQFRVFLAQF